MGYILIAVSLSLALAKDEVCTDFRKNVVDCQELANARKFNMMMNEGNHEKTPYRKIRKLMTASGLVGKRWNVGHIEPNEPKSKRDKGPEDLGQNLMAQSARDNRTLGNKRVSKEELAYYHRKSDFCSWTCPNL